MLAYPDCVCSLLGLFMFFLCCIRRLSATNGLLNGLSVFGQTGGTGAGE